MGIDLAAWNQLMLLGMLVNFWRFLGGVTIGDVLEKGSVVG